MADINQSLGFDASGAIKSITDLSFSIDTVNQSIRTLSQTAAGDPLRGFRAAGEKSRGVVTELERRVLGLRNEFKATGPAGSKAGNEITASWQTVIRIFTTQAILRGLSELRQAFFTTADAAREFELTIARTEAIAKSTDIGASFDEIAISVRQLAVELGQPITDVQSAAYQSLQNDIGNTVDSLDFLRTANKLAVVTGSELEGSVNAITSVLKAYNLDVSEAAGVSDVFFKTIDVGRISLDELENRLGTILPQAAALGIGFKQTAAAAASLTLSGLDTAKATTQLRNIFAKLLKPTQALQGAFKSLGFETGQELVQAFGGDLPKILAALRDEFGGSEVAVANAFNTIRGQLGVLNLLSNEGAELNRVLGEFGSTSGILQEAFDKVQQTDARKYATEVAKVNDILLQLGGTASRFQTSALGVFNFLIPNIQTASGVLTAFGVAGAAAFARIAVSSTIAGNAVRAAFGPVGLVIGAVSAAVGVLVANFQTQQSQLEDYVAVVNKRQSDIQRNFEKAQQENTKTLDRNLEEQRKSLGSFYQDVAKYYSDDVAAFTAASDRIQITFDRLGSDFKSSRESLLSGLESFISGIDGQLQDSISGVIDASRELDDFQFERLQKGFNDAGKAANELARAQQTGLAAARALQSAGDNKELQKQAQDLQKIAEQQAKAALSSADQLKNGRLIAAAESTVAGILKQAQDAELQRAQKLAGIDTERLKIQADRVKQLTQEQNSIQQQISQLSSNVTAEGIPKSQQEQIDSQALVDELQQRLDAVNLQITNVEVVKLAGLDSVATQTKDAFQRGIDTAQFDFRKAVAQFQESLLSRQFEAVVNLKFSAESSTVQAVSDQLAQAGTQDTFSKSVETGLAVRNQFLKEQLALEAESAKLNAEIVANITAAGEASRNATQNIGIVGSLQNLASGGGALFTPTSGNQEAIKFQDQLLAAIVRVRDEGAPAIDSVRQSLKQLEVEIGSSDLEARRVDQLKEAISRLQVALDAIKVRNETITPNIASDAERAAVEAEIENLKKQVGEVGNTIRQSATPATNDLGAAATGVDNNFQGVVSTLQAIQREAALAAAQTAQIGIGGGSQTAYFGSPVYRATGGDMTRGQDQSLVAASAGEVITNARSSSKFFAELRAINAGQAPMFREQGGPVTNVGDINVNVDARNANNVDGRQIARTLNREIRRGSTSLRG